MQPGYYVTVFRAYAYHSFVQADDKVEAEERAKLNADMTPQREWDTVEESVSLVDPADWLSEERG